jgi:hypothetical protein
MTLHGTILRMPRAGGSAARSAWRTVWRCSLIFVLPVATACTSSAPTVQCTEWTLRDVGPGVSAALPNEAVSVFSLSTADAGPQAPFFASNTFEIDGTEVGIGRQRGEPLQANMALIGGRTNSPPDQVLQTSINGITMFVATADDHIRQCVFDSLRYDPTTDTGV